MSMIHQCSEEQWSALLAALRERHDRDEAEMPDDRSALLVMFRGHDRLRQLGWREISYCPKDGSTFEVIEAGSSGIHRAHYEGTWPDGHWWIHEDGDLWPAHPILFRLIQDAAQGMEAAQADETRSGSAEGDSPTRRDAPPSLPPTGEGLPEEILKAIDALELAAEDLGASYDARGFPAPEREEIANEYRSTLDATILHHLYAARAERDELRASVQKMHRRCQSGEADLQGLVDHLRSGVDVWMNACRTAEEALSAALARAERAEKALDKLEAHRKRLFEPWDAKKAIWPDHPAQYRFGDGGTFTISYTNKEAREILAALSPVAEEV